MSRAEAPRSYLITTWEGGGSVAPLVTVARKLRARGHRVRVMSDACNRGDAEAADAEFVAWTRAPSRTDRSPASDPLRDWALEGPAGFIQVIGDVWAASALEYAQDVIAELRREAADLVITCEHLFGVAVGCQALGQPYCLLEPNISLFPMPGVPPLGPGLPPARNADEAAQHAEIAAMLVEVFDSAVPGINRARTALGLTPVMHTSEVFADARAVLLGTARAFDFAPATLPPRVQYVGPQLDTPAWARPWSSRWPADDTRPLVLVGFSTTFQDHAGALQRVIDAAADLPVRVLVTLGGSIAADDLTPAPNTCIVDSAPHETVMKDAALLVTHGGHGTVVRALAHRLPMLVVAHGRDQNDNAARVTERGAGLALPPSASTEDIRAALVRLLDEPGFSRSAARLGEAVAQEMAQSPIVEVLERLAAEAARESLRVDGGGSFSHHPSAYFQPESLGQADLSRSPIPATTRGNAR